LFAEFYVRGVVVIGRRQNSSDIIGLNLLVLWAGLSGIWNIYGGLQLIYGGDALGPTPGISTAVFMFALAAAVIVTSTHWPLAYVALASFTGVMAGMNILHIINGSAASWMSTFWLYVAIVINVSGVVGAALVITHPFVAPAMRFRRWCNSILLDRHRKSRIH
jgi:hypothetical protein